MRALIYDGNYFSPNLDFLYVRLRNSLQLSQPSLLLYNIIFLFTKQITRQKLNRWAIKDRANLVLPPLCIPMVWSHLRRFQWSYYPFNYFRCQNLICRNALRQATDVAKISSFVGEENKATISATSNLLSGSNDEIITHPNPGKCIRLF